MKTYKISDRLMNLLVDYFMYGNESVHDEIVQELNSKIDAMVRRANYRDKLQERHSSVDNNTHA